MAYIHGDDEATNATKTGGTDPALIQLITKMLAATHCAIKVSDDGTTLSISRSDGKRLRGN
jgi:hypothetical protein